MNRKKLLISFSLILAGVFLLGIIYLARRQSPKADVVTTSGDILPRKSTSTIWGHIKYKDTQLPAGNIIVLFNGTGVTTTSDGYYFFTTPDSGEFTLWAESPDSKTVYQFTDNPEQTIQIDEGSNQQINLIIEKNDSDPPLLIGAAPSPSPSSSASPTATPTPVAGITTPTPTPAPFPTPVPTPTPVTKNFPVIGYLDAIDSNGYATGWTFDPDVPARSISVEFYLDGGGGVGSYIGYVYADILSDDVNNVFKVTGRHRFSFFLPNTAVNGKPIRDGKPHTVWAHGIDTDGTGLNNSLLTKPMTVTLKPLRIFCSVFDLFCPKSTATTITPISIPTLKPSVGTLDGINLTNGTAFGWAYDPDVTAQSIPVEFYLDGGGGVGKLIGRTITTYESPDVNSVFGITGVHRFSYTLPAKTQDGTVIRDGKPHKLYVHAIDTDNTGKTNSPLNGTGKQFTLK